MNTDSPEVIESASSDIETDDIQVETQRVPNKRVCAYLIDFFVIDLAYVVFSGAISGVPEVSLSLLFIVYLLIKDALFNGQSIGKFAAGLRVVDLQGRPCDLPRSGLRNLIFVAPLLILGIVSQLAEPITTNPDVPDIPRDVYWLLLIVLFLYVIEYSVMLRSKWERRSGDRLAGTKVQDLRPDRPDWWFFLFSILVFVLLFFISRGTISLSPG